MIIGLMGYAQVGKDTVAKTLVEAYGFTRIAFADALRDAAYALNPIVHTYAVNDDGTSTYATVQSLVDERGWDAAKQFPEVRRILQVLGTEVGREIIGPNVWVDIAMRKVHGTGRYVFTDVRFPNEVAAISRERGTLVRVRRPGYGPVNGHGSESALDGVEPDHTITNVGTQNDLVVLVHDLVHSLEAK